MLSMFKLADRSSEDRFSSFILINISKQFQLFIKKADEVKERTSEKSTPDEIAKNAAMQVLKQTLETDISSFQDNSEQSHHYLVSVMLCHLLEHLVTNLSVINHFKDAKKKVASLATSAASYGAAFGAASMVFSNPVTLGVATLAGGKTLSRSTRETVEFKGRQTDSFAKVLGLLKAVAETNVKLFELEEKPDPTVMELTDRLKRAVHALNESAPPIYVSLLIQKHSTISSHSPR